MAELRIALGARADVVSGEELKSAITGLQGHIDKRYSEMTSRDVRPIRKEIRAAGAVGCTIGGQTASVILSNETPSVERYWQVRSIAVYNAASPLTGEYATSQFWLGVGNANQPSAADLTGDTWQGIPHGNTFNSSAIRVLPGENLYIITSASVSDNVGFTIAVDEVSDWVNQQRI